MEFKLKLILSLNLLMFCVVISYTQTDQVVILNDVISTLKGEQGNEDIKSFSTLKEACKSKYITCDRKGRIEGLDFQFANLNGHIPENINQLVDLEYANLTFNYLDGTIPNGLTKLPDLEELSLSGNFLEGPLPSDIRMLNKKVDIDLSQNTFKKVDPRWAKKLNIKNQFNLEGCRSPDSIFLVVDIGKVKKLEILDGESMPRFSGCEKGGLSEEERLSCSKNKMLHFIFRNLKYPNEAREEGLQGMAIIQFVVLENGDISDAVIKRDPGGRCGNAALWVINRMNYICNKWIPGTQGGNDVKVEYVLPVQFSLRNH
ncbi:MAG: TonB family protein [Saprospiraceae bacterium]|jgi:TonB family protein